MKLFWFLLPLLLSACNTSKNLISNRPEVPFTADGKSDDWGENLLYNVSEHIFYKVANDRHNLYLMLRITDENMVRKVLMTGLTVWIDTTNHGKEKFGITFPRGQMRSGRMSRTKNQGKLDQPPTEIRMQDRLKESATDMEMHAYDLDEPVVMFLTESKLKPVINLDSTGALVYELVLPFPYFIQNRNTTKPISIGFVIGLENPMNRNPQGRYATQRGEGDQEIMPGEGDGMDGGMHRGMNGGMSEGMRRGNGGGSGRAYSRNPQGSTAYGAPVKIWMKNYVLNRKETN